MHTVIKAGKDDFVDLIKTAIAKADSLGIQVLNKTVSKPI